MYILTWSSGGVMIMSVVWGGEWVGGGLSEGFGIGVGCGWF